MPTVGVEFAKVSYTLPDGAGRVLLREISLQEELQATNDQVDAEFDRLLDTGTIAPLQYDEYKNDRQRRLQVSNALIQKRLHDFLFAHTSRSIHVCNAPSPAATSAFPIGDMIAGEVARQRAALN